MSKLVEVLANLPAEQVEGIVKTWIGNEVFEITANASEENQAETLAAIADLRSSPLVQALSDDGKAAMFEILDLAVRLVSTPDE